MEHHWVLAQKELDQEKVFRDKIQNESTQDFESALAKEKESHAKTCNENEDRVSELKKAHQKQCDELCREILKANLEAVSYTHQTLPTKKIVQSHTLVRGQNKQ